MFSVSRCVDASPISHSVASWVIRSTVQYYGAQFNEPLFYLIMVPKHKKRDAGNSGTLCGFRQPLRVLEHTPHASGETTVFTSFYIAGQFSYLGVSVSKVILMSVD